MIGVQFPTIFRLKFFPVLEFSKNRVAAVKARQAIHTLETIFSRFFYALSGGYVLTTRRQELACPISSGFFCSSGMVMLGLDFYMYVYDWHDELLSIIVIWWKLHEALYDWGLCLMLGLGMM